MDIWSLGLMSLSSPTVDFSNEELSSLDEALSTINAGKALVSDSRFIGCGKLVLCGNGDHPDNDSNGVVLFHRCHFENFGRRGPEAQDGVTVILMGCTIENWGIKERFDTRCFGAWAHSGAKITAVNCSFIQNCFWQTGFINFFRDIANHIGNAFNERGFFGLTWKDFIPGVCRGLTASDGGQVKAIQCCKNKWWIRIEG